MFDRPAVSFHYFGEATTPPVRIVKAAVRTSSAPAIKQSLTQLDLTVVNDQVPGDISAKLRLPLPVGATVCRFEFERKDKWYPAVPVEERKAKEVVYKEREKGRSVAAASQAQGNVFEIEVFPLPHNKHAHCRLWYSHSDKGELPFTFDNRTEVTREDHTVGGTASLTGACLVGTCFGQKHYAIYVPPIATPSTTTLPKRIALVWDVSGSQDQDQSVRFARLRDLAARCPGASFDVWTFGITYQHLHAAVSVEKAIAALSQVALDGGTDLTVVPRLLCEVGPVDAVLLFSDGMDNLNRRPMIDGPCPPVHCVADQAETNLQALRRFCLSTGGQLLRGDYVAVLHPRALLTHIETDQDDAAFCDPEDAFTCCPDHRLRVQVPIGEEGLWISGTVGAVKKLGVHLKVGGANQEFPFDLSNAPDIGSDAAPLLGFLHAREQYSAVERDGAAMGVDLAQVKTNLAVQYGFCSPEASLLMLYEPEQFLENNVQCPEDHPSYPAWKQASEACARPGSTAEVKVDLGQPKTQQQMAIVARLAKELQKYMTKPIPEKADQTVAQERFRCSMTRSRGFARRSLGGGVARAQLGCIETNGYGSAPVACSLEMDESDCASECAVGCAAGGGGGDLLDMDGALDGAVGMARCIGGDDLADSGDGSRDGDSHRRERRGSNRSTQSQSTGTGPSDGGRDCEAYVQGKEEAYLKSLELALKSGAWQKVYKELRREHGTSPSFFLYAAGLLLAHAPARSEEAARICTNCLEFKLQDTQMTRSVGYFLIKAGQLELALAVLDHVRTLAPMEPQSFLDGALARTLFLQRRGFQEAMLREAVCLASVAVTSQWAQRFEEVEWPALVLLHLLCESGEKRHGLSELWPLDAALRTPNFSVGVMVWLGWDTDKTDIDLHVVEPSGNEVFYSNKRSSIGGHLSKDFTDGYGPEVYLCRDAPQGKYEVKAKYYASHQLSTLTGATSAVVWALVRGDGPSSEPKVLFDTVRLDRNKEMMNVYTLRVPAAPQETAPAARGPVGATPAARNDVELRFMDTDGDEILLKREGQHVNMYVNGKREIESLKEFAIDPENWTYRDDSGKGTFTPEEDLGVLMRQRDLLFAQEQSPSGKAKGRGFFKSCISWR